MLLFLALPIIFLYLYYKLHYRRFRKYANFPQLKSSLVWGHLQTLRKVHKDRDRVDGDIDPVFGDLMEQAGNPPVLFIDFWPLNEPMLLIRNHDVAEQVSKQSQLWPYSLPKSPSFKEYLPLVGDHSLIWESGDHWKTLRKLFNPGFAPKHLMTLLSVVLDKTKIFVQILDEDAAKADVFDLSSPCTNLTFDIIGAVTMDEDLHAQDPDVLQNDFIQNYKRFAATYRDDGSPSLLPSFSVRWERRRLGQALDTFLGDVVRRKFDLYKADSNTTSRIVLALSLKDINVLTQPIMDDIISALKTFLFAGHDTTSILLQWALYELSSNPQILARMRNELDRVFGQSADLDRVLEMIYKGGEEVVGQLKYTSAVIKEVLRLHPPAATARYSPPATGFHLVLPDGSRVCADDLMLYNCNYLIHRDPQVYGETKDDFVPERWLDASATDPQASAKFENGHIPPSSWRPFERGPRNCIGQELANIEAKVILVVLVGRYDFVKQGLGSPILGVNGDPLLDAKGRHITESDVYNS
ncbi:putative sterigmatocystin biosynthesis P450 monooxygenase stcS [Colletotrichum siamense]|uniref:putative sterigmatocystin biosynthesis P450 monooxygenase stcS n=1 Tax=Colletotrichum siamense TaxID=690259 RepID=UPI001872ECE0|nr:putative sterigmatocystin biosynthesis P450 monooxygenase stcS [Colletotrichum siamense]KAF5496836.1 putative sterigmatocystin biosynthesis P450 monooxygenase stcS [Colletotrichum siamense]